jgi:hypothetical protein
MKHGPGSRFTDRESRQWIPGSMLRIAPGMGGKRRTVNSSYAAAFAVSAV